MVGFPPEQRQMLAIQTVSGRFLRRLAVGKCQRMRRSPRWRAVRVATSSFKFPSGPSRSFPFLQSVSPFHDFAVSLQARLLRPAHSVCTRALAFTQSFLHGLVLASHLSSVGDVAVVSGELSFLCQGFGLGFLLPFEVARSGVSSGFLFCFFFV